VGGPVVPLQVFQQRKALFEPFQILAHGAGFPSRVKPRRRKAAFPSKNDGRLSFFRAARSRTDRNKGIEFAGTTAGNPSEEACLHPVPGFTACIVGRKNENGGREESRLRNHRRKVDGSVTRWGSLRAGAAASHPQRSTK
jgi:hypothetical protein